MIRAIDIHTHPPTPEEYMTEDQKKNRAAMAAHYGARAYAQQSWDIDQFADHYAKMESMAVMLVSDNETISGNPPLPMKLVADWAKKYPKQLIGFGGIDPHKGKVALNQLDEIAGLGLRGLKFHSGSQHFFANDTQYYPLWERCAKLGLICLFHSGSTGVGAGRPGGGGIKLEPMKPVPYVDDVAADFPELKIILAHPSFPWDKEGLSVIIHKPNVWMDLSGYSPDYMDPLVIQYTKTIAKDKMLFGSDWPVVTPTRWIADWKKQDIPEEINRKLFRDNAAKLLGMEELITDDWEMPVPPPVS